MFPLYVNKGNKEVLQQIKTLASIEEKKTSTLIFNAIKKSLQPPEDRLIWEASEWEKQIENLSQDDAMKLDKLILNAHDIILKRVWTEE